MYISGFQLAFYLTIKKENIVNNNVLFIKLQEKIKMSFITKAKNFMRKYQRF